MDNAALRLLLTLTAPPLIWLVYTAIYRLFFHPLATIPGPKLAALTHWYEFYFDVIQPGQYVFHIKRLHETYGPIIRITPREVHVKDVSFLKEIYPTSNARKREKDAFQLRNLGLPFATAGTRDHELHRQRREALNPFFSQRRVFELEPLLKKKVAQLGSHLQAATKPEGTDIANLSDLYYAFARE